jgi:hypothetical protein
MLSDPLPAVNAVIVGAAGEVVGVPFIAFDAGESPLALTALIVTE